METSTAKQGLHPLLTAAAISVTVFSAAGIGALTGVLPSSIGSSKESAPAEISTPATSSSPAERHFSALQEMNVQEFAGMPPAATAATPKAAPRPAKKVVARTPAPQPVGNVTERDFSGPAPYQVAQAPAEPVAAPQPAPKPIPGILGVVESVREVSTPAKTSNGVGPIAGGIAGAILGDQIGKDMGGSNTRKVVTVLGAAAGAFGGRAIESHARATKHWEVSVRLDDGSSRMITTDAAPYWKGGERIRFLDGRLSPA